MQLIGLYKNYPNVKPTIAQLMGTEISKLLKLQCWNLLSAATYVTVRVLLVTLLLCIEIDIRATMFPLFILGMYT